MSARFTRLFIIVGVIIFFLTSLFVLSAPAQTYIDRKTGSVYDEGSILPEFNDHKLHSRPKGVEGGVIMPKLANETAKAALGQATWKLMHTMTLRYPEDPTEDERDALNSYFYLQARLYPCGECAAEFQQLLSKFPPQTSSRRSASLWLCHLHNQVNERLGKPDFDCAHLDETYDCGCGDSDEHSTSEKIAETANELYDVDLDTGFDLVRGGR